MAGTETSARGSHGLPESSDLFPLQGGQADSGRDLESLLGGRTNQTIVESVREAIMQALRSHVVINRFDRDWAGRCCSHEQWHPPAAVAMIAGI